MNNFLKITILAAVLAVVVTACNEDELMVYEGESNIFFTLKKWPSGIYGYSATLQWEENVVKFSSNSINEAVDSLSISYATGDVKTPFLLVPVDVMGDVVDYDREIACRATGGSAREGTDFHIRTAYIPAGRIRGGILLEIPRPSPPLEEITIDLELIPNQYFMTNFPTVERSSVDTTTVSTISFRVWVGSKLTKPAYWRDDCYGTWTVSKVYLMVEELGIPMSFIYKEMPSTSVMMTYGSMLKRYLINNPTWDDELGRNMDYGTNPNL